MLTNTVNEEFALGSYWFTCYRRSVKCIFLLTFRDDFDNLLKSIIAIFGKTNCPISRQLASS